MKFRASQSAMNSDAVGRVATLVRGAEAHVVGAICMWSLASVRVPRAQLHSDMEQIGLGEAVARAPKPGSLLRKACNSVESESIVFDRVSVPGGGAVFAASDRRVREHDRRVDYQLRCRIAVTADGTIVREDPNDPLLERVAHQYVELRDYAHSDEVSSVLVRSMHGHRGQPLLNALNLRGAAGGVYFVPAAEMGRLRALQAWVLGQSEHSEFSVWEITGSDAHLEQAARSAVSSFRSKLKAVSDECAAFVADMRDTIARSETDQKAEAALEGSLAVRKARYNALSAQVYSYAEILGERKQALLDEIAEAREALRAAIEGPA